MENGLPRSARAKRRRRVLAAILATVAAILTGGCGGKPAVADQELRRALLAKDPLRSIAVLPFGDRTGTKGLAEMMRNGFYSHLSVLAYEDRELYEVDARLAQSGVSPAAPFTRASLQKLGRTLKVDAVVFGEVTEFERLYAVLYSQLSLGASISIYDTRNGSRLWNDSHVSRFHEGGLPLEIISLPLVGMRSGMNLRETVKQRAVDELCRELTRRIPSPAVAAVNEESAPRQGYAVQTGSFLEERLAVEHLSTLRRHGFEAFVRKERIHGDLWHRVLVGPFAEHEQAMRARERVRREIQSESYVCRVSLTARQLRE
jgi:hypothetical protein